MATAQPAKPTPTPAPTENGSNGHADREKLTLEYKRALARLKRSLADIRDDGAASIDVGILEARCVDLVAKAKALKAAF